jgi:hypothetical protein
MFQRKQTLFLLLAAAFALLTFAFPIATYSRGDAGFVFRTTGLFTSEGVEVQDASTRIPFAILIGVLAAALIACVFLYKNRTRQMGFVRGTYMLTLIVIASMFVTDSSITSYLSQSGKVATHYGASAVLPLFTMILAFLAERAIRKDEELVKSADRLR